jgi:hypothetical protein
MLDQRKIAYKRRGITLNYHKQAIELQAQEGDPKVQRDPFSGTLRRSQVIRQSISSVFLSCATNQDTLAFKD